MMPIEAVRVSTESCSAAAIASSARRPTIAVTRRGDPSPAVDPAQPQRRNGDQRAGNLAAPHQLHHQQRHEVEDRKPIIAGG